MEEITSLMNGFVVVLTPYNLGLMMVGIVLGVLIGVLTTASEGHDMVNGELIAID